MLDLYGQDEDSSYAGTTTVGTSLLVKTQTGAIIPPVAGVGYVAVMARARRAGPGSEEGAIAPLIKSGAVTVQGLTVNLTTSYADYGGYGFPGWWLETDPTTGLPWTLDAALAAEIGLFNATAEGEFPQAVRCTKLRKLVLVNHAGRVGAVRGPDEPRWWRS
jgi:hypothetical protein